MNPEELIAEACKRMGCQEDMFCFGGKHNILCKECIVECRALRKVEMEEEEKE
jgi:hypothetical protein